MRDYIKKKQEFYGTSDDVEYDFIPKIINLRTNIPVNVPEKDGLIKMKAAWDRSSQLMEGHSYNTGYLKSKLIKDFGDIIALMDRRFDHGASISLSSLSNEFSIRPYLRNLLVNLAERYSTLVNYRDFDGKAVHELIENILSIV